MKPPQLLSDLLASASVGLSRRKFVSRVPLLALGAAACARKADDDGKTAVASDSTPQAQQHPGAINSDSRLDTATVRGRPHVATTSSADAANVTYKRYDPALPPVAKERTTRIHFTARETPVRISPTSVVAAWTFEGDIPGPVLHVRQGDKVEFTLTNAGDIPHSMDFHATQTDPKIAFRSVVKGESVSYTFNTKYPGAFMYHCGTAPVLMHIGSGMYGAIIVDPLEPLPAAKEFVLVQNEYYLSDGPNGISTSDYRKMATTLPDYVAFNGRPDQYIGDPIRVQRGDRVRFYVVCCGPTHPCNFHIVGEQFDTVYLGAPPSVPIRGVQTFSVPPGGGMIFDLVADVAGEFPFVNHGFGHGQKGAIGFLHVEG